MSDLNIAISKELVEPVIREKISAAIVSQLGDAEEVMRKAIEIALNEKVNVKGVKSNRSYDNQYPFMEVLASNAIRDAAREAVKDWVEEKRPMIEKAVRTRLNRSQAKIAKVLVDSFAEKATSEYALKLDMKIEKQSRY